MTQLYIYIYIFTYTCIHTYALCRYWFIHFSYDLLFGVTESESYHTLGALALEAGLRENERDNLLRFYMQTRFDVRPDLALAATLKK